MDATPATERQKAEKNTKKRERGRTVEKRWQNLNTNMSKKAQKRKLKQILETQTNPTIYDERKAI